jgi:PhnB protein
MMMTHKEAPSAEHVSPEWHDKIMHVCLDLGDRLLMGSDSPPEYFEAPQGFYVQISVAEPADAERIFHALGRKRESQDVDRSNFLVCSLWHVG